MTDAAEGFTKLPLPLVQEMDRLADAFEVALQRGERPDATAFVDKLDSQDPDIRDLLRSHLNEVQAELEASVSTSTGSGVARLPIEFASSAGEVTVGEYQLTETIGSGGMGVVFKARHLRLDRFVAIKFPRFGAGHNELVATRFLREARVIGALDHPNIVRALDAGDSPFGPYLVTELVDGESVEQRVQRDGALPFDAAISILLEVAGALAYAHEQGVWHRDVKPSNLLLDKRGVAQIVDFGLAKPEGTADGAGEIDPTFTHAFLGTIAYAAPEQLRPGEVVDNRADVYSLGCVLYFLLTGEQLHSGSLADRLLSEPRSFQSALARAHVGVPERLNAVWRRMVARKPADRYRSMAEAARDLSAAVSTTAAPSRRVSGSLTAAAIGVIATASLLVLHFRGELTEGKPKSVPSVAIAPFSAEAASKHQARWARYLDIPVRVVNTIGMPLVLTPPADFEMGVPDETMISKMDPANWRAQDDKEMERLHRPLHRVMLTKPIYFGATEVTFEQFESFIAATGYITDAERSKGWGREDRGWLKRAGYSWKNTGQRVSEENQPVINVSWNDSVAFCAWLTEHDPLGEYRLPTESEWEFACRAGSTTTYYFGEDPAAISEHAWTEINSDGRYRPVAQKRPNPFGIYDLYGNRQEWCLDNFSPDFYSISPQIDPLCEDDRGVRVLRGGTHTDAVEFCTSARRWGQDADDVGAAGIRVVCEIK